MVDILRPRFRQPCFECGEPVPAPRVERLRHIAEQQGRAFLKSDLLCVVCGPAKDAESRDCVVSRPSRPPSNT
jgi:hypothetical protein